MKRKKIYKLLFILVLVMGVLSICTTNYYVSAEEVIQEVEDEIPTNDNIEDLLEEEPSELAKWIEEHVIEIIVGTSTGSALFIAALFYVIAWLKKKTREMNDERTATEKSIKDYSKEVKTLINVNANLLKEYQELKLEIKDLRDENKKTRETFEQLKEEQATTKEMLRIGFSNDKELVRLGVAEEINTIAKKGV